MVNRLDDREKTIRESSRKAIALAMESRWQEAAELNRAVVDLAPDDVDALNRLGKALLEMGDSRGARDAFNRVLELAPSNTIARKNLDRIASMPQETANCVAGHRIAPRLFIGDSGKSARVSLIPVSNAPRPYLSPGAPIELRIEGDDLYAYTTAGQQLGLVPPRLGRRLVRLIGGGNVYQGAIFNVAEDEVRVVLHETYRSPSQRNIVSFPADRAETEVERPVAAPAQTAVQDDEEIDWDLPSSWKEDQALDVPLEELDVEPVEDEEFDDAGDEEDEE